MFKSASSNTLAAWSVAVAVLVMALKVMAWRMTGSVALYSDALESLVNIAGALVAVMAIRIARRPADDNHPFGHHKAENFSAMAEGSMIVIAAALIMWEAAKTIADPTPVQFEPAGLWVNAAAMGINLAWARILISAGRARRSPALEASGRHLMSDVWTSAGVIAGLVLVIGTGWTILDPLMALLVAVNILREGSLVIRRSADELMDSAVSETEAAQIADIVRGSATGALQIHDLKTRRAGPALFIEFHLVVPRDMTVADAHDICDTIEAAIASAIPKSRATIHVEPEEKLKPTGLDPH